MITFIEKNRYYNDRNRYYDDSPFTGGCYFYPTYMVKDGKEYFVFNRREPDDSWKIKENEIWKNQLVSTDGKYFAFHGFYDNPLDMLKEIIKRKHHFCRPDNVYENLEEYSCSDFHGNRNEVSAAFHYRIYDKELSHIIKQIVECINKEKWTEANQLVDLKF